MGQNNSKESETINWNQIKTNDMSSTIPNMEGISIEAKELISRLNLPEISESNSEFNIDNHFENINNHLEINNQESDIDATSPFISSDMYNYLVNKYPTKNTDTNINMLGGAKVDEDSETSSTSSSLSSSALKSSSSETDEKSIKKNKKINKKTNKNIKKNSDSKDDESDENVKITDDESDEHIELVAKDNYEGISKKYTSQKGKSKKDKLTKSKKSNYTGTENYLSYVSSSAHTNVTESLTNSIANENNYTISTVNTSDINMISE